jgi:Domain of unknown function (DUF4157)
MKVRVGRPVAAKPSFTAAAQTSLQRRCACGGSAGPTGECTECGADKSTLQRKAAQGARADAAVPPSVYPVLQSAGQPLESPTRRMMENRLGHDFARVRVHVDSQAAASAHEVKSLAYTVGQHIVFASGRFAPHSAAGQRLLTHELVHTMQQGHAAAAHAPAGGLKMGGQSDSFEREADDLAASALGRPAAGAPGAAFSASTDAAGALRRDGDDTKADPVREPARDPAANPANPANPAPPPPPPPCTPQGFARADYLKQPGTSVDDFGLTTLDGTVTVPAVHVSKTAKGWVLDPTDAQLPPLASVYTAAGNFIEGEIISLGDGGDCPSGRKYPKQWRILPSGANKIREGEAEHCADFQYAFAVSLKRYADVVNDLSAKKHVFGSQKAAEKYVANIVGPAPDTWADVFSCLAKKTKDRDTSQWHTPRPLVKPPSLDDECKFSRLYISGLPEVGKHPSADVINGCGEGPPKAKGAAKPPRAPAGAPPTAKVSGSVEKPLIVNGPGDSHAPQTPPPAPPKSTPPSQSPKQPAPPTRPTCPADIKVAAVGPFNDRDFGKDGYRTGWGSIARMEVLDPDGRDWADTQIHEQVKQVKNTCGARARKVCSNESGDDGSGGSTFKVGAPGQFLGKASQPAVKNGFYDLHIFSLKNVSILHELDKAECEIQCQQTYSCGGKPIGPTFDISYALAKDTAAGYDVTRVVVHKVAAPAAATPPPPPPAAGK